METVMSNETGKEPQIETVEVWELEICTCPQGTPPMLKKIPGERQLRCCKCLRPYSGINPNNYMKQYTSRLPEVPEVVSNSVRNLLDGGDSSNLEHRVVEDFLCATVAYPPLTI